MKSFYYRSLALRFLQIFVLFNIGNRQVYADLNTQFGCYQVDESLSVKGNYQFLTPQYCYDHLCNDDPNVAFVAVREKNCYCGNTLTAQKVDSSNCNKVCPGWDQFKCGGDLYWSVYLTGSGILHTSSSQSSSSTSSTHSSSKTSSTPSSTTSSTSSSAPSSKPTSSSHSPSSSQSSSRITSPSSSSSHMPTTFSSSYVRSVTPSPTSSSSSSTGSPNGSQGSKMNNSLNTGAIVGIVIGCVAFAVVIALCICLYFWYRKFKARMNAKDDITFPSYKSELDSRLDPGMLKNRNSAESLADSQDYSRRILRVMN
ncbi:plasma membrane-associated serine-rich cell wall sensor Wsc1 [Schizosaccharomyces osmophilus]|uniref:Plasma membrane-associated serine-rich cell wall sensor Wsc1 n=1 Tax=Schizosaccharomyces osmophilus TaxID=2545709 RepID=A0AAE9WD93_9SCHI|nr:plasma membrane-associated serine-rich cell wall sensor Wsc1 [Schizosaccharomyces osmophilus]WBW72563.1 plasma membrane-associated serine-rich cell wall sensor Wsc1 [Schizosaccharomyces osmophilus]